MDVKKLVQRFNPPCDKCPYKLGLVHTLVNPCPQCRENGYRMFDRLQKQLLGENLNDERS